MPEGLTLRARTRAGFESLDATRLRGIMRSLFRHGPFLVVLCCALVLATAAHAQATQPPSEEIDQLVAPIALYPDPLVAQVLAAATYPVEMVEAWRWKQAHSALQGQALADALDSQPWDPSVKAITQFPALLDSMNANLSWTSALGDAYANQPDSVLGAVQVMRQRAQSAGRLQSTSQQTVTTQDQSIAIEPASPDLVYLPAYDPWLVYGDPLAVYPGWVGVPGIFYDGPDLYFGLGLGVGLFAGAAWGWNHWGFDWHDRRMLHDHAPYASHGPTFAHHHDGGGAHPDHRAGDSGAILGRGPERSPGFTQVPRGQNHAIAGAGAFSGFDHGGVVRGYSARGQSSLGEGFHTGGLPGGGFHGGGGFAGGGHGGGGGGHR
jgi:uncharacterized membrane protein YgcG